MAPRKVEQLVPFVGDSHLQSCTTLGTVTGKSNNRLQLAWTSSAVLLRPAGLPCQPLDATPWGGRPTVTDSWHQKNLLSFLHLWVKLIAQQTWPDKRGLHHSHIKVLKHLSTVLYSAKASWKALEKLPDLQKYLHICLPVKSVSLQHGSPLGSVLTSGCVSQLLPEQRNVPAARSSALWLSTAP